MLLSVGVYGDTIPMILETGMEPHPDMGVGRQMWPYPYRCRQTEWEKVDTSQNFAFPQRVGDMLPARNGIKPAHVPGGGYPSDYRLCFPYQTKIRGGICGVPHDQWGVGSFLGILNDGVDGYDMHVWDPLRTAANAEFFGTFDNPVPYPASDLAGSNWWSSFRQVSTAKYGCVCFDGFPPAEPVYRPATDDYYMDWLMACSHTTQQNNYGPPLVSTTIPFVSEALSNWPNKDWQADGLVFEQNTPANHPIFGGTPQMRQMVGYGSTLTQTTMSPNQVMTYCDGSSDADGLHWMGCACAKEDNAWYNAMLQNAPVSFIPPLALTGGRDIGLIATGSFGRIVPIYDDVLARTITGWTVFPRLCSGFLTTLPAMFTSVIQPTPGGSRNFSRFTDRQMWNAGFSTANMPNDAPNQGTTQASNRVCGLDPQVLGNSSDPYSGGGCECDPGWYANGFDADVDPDDLVYRTRLASRMTQTAAEAVVGPSSSTPMTAFYGLQASANFGSAWLMPPGNAGFSGQASGIGCYTGSGTIQEFTPTPDNGRALYVCRSILGNNDYYDCSVGNPSVLRFVLKAVCPLSVVIPLNSDWLICPAIPTDSAGPRFFFWPSGCSWRFPPDCTHPHCTNREDQYDVNQAEAIVRPGSGPPGDGNSPRNKYVCSIKTTISSTHVWISTAQQGPQVANVLAVPDQCGIILSDQPTRPVPMVTVPYFTSAFPGHAEYCGQAGQINTGCLSPAVILTNSSSGTHPPPLHNYWIDVAGIDQASIRELLFWSDWRGPYPSMREINDQGPGNGAWFPFVESQFCNCLPPSYYIADGWQYDDPNRARGMDYYAQQSLIVGGNWVLEFTRAFRNMCQHTDGSARYSPAEAKTPCSPGVELAYTRLNAKTNRVPARQIACECSVNSAWTPDPVNLPPLYLPAPNRTQFWSNELFTDWVIGNVPTPRNTPTGASQTDGFIRSITVTPLPENCRGVSCASLDNCNPFMVTQRPAWQNFPDKDLWDEAAFNDCVTSGLGSENACRQLWRDNNITINECIADGLDGNGTPQPTCQCDHSGFNAAAGTPYGLWFHEVMNCAPCVQGAGGVCFMPEVEGSGGTRCWWRYDNYADQIWAGSQPFCDCNSNQPSSVAIGRSGCTSRGECIYDPNGHDGSGDMACVCEPYNNVDGLDVNQDCKGCKEYYGPTWINPGSELSCALPLGPGSVEGSGDTTTRYENILRTSCGGFSRSVTIDKPPMHECVCNIDNFDVYPPLDAGEVMEDIATVGFVPVDHTGYGTADILGENDDNSIFAELEPDLASPIATQAGWRIPDTIPSGGATGGGAGLSCTVPRCPGFCNGPELGDLEGHVCVPALQSDNGIEHFCRCADSKGRLYGQQGYQAHFLPIWIEETQRWQSGCMPNLCQNGWFGEYCDVSVCNQDVFTLQAAQDVICGTNITRLISGDELKRFDDDPTSTGLPYGCEMVPFDDTGEPITTNFVGLCHCVEGLRGYLGCQFSMGHWPSPLDIQIPGDCVDPNAPAFLADKLCYGNGVCVRKNTMATMYDAALLEWTNDEGFECSECVSPYIGSPYCGDVQCATKFGTTPLTADPCKNGGKCVAIDADPNNSFCNCASGFQGDLCEIDVRAWCVQPGTQLVCSGRGSCEETALPPPDPPYECICDPDQGSGQWCETQPCEGGSAVDCAFGECVADSCICNPSSIWTNNPGDNNRCNLSLCVEGEPDDTNDPDAVCVCDPGFFGDLCDNPNCPFDTTYNPPRMCGAEGPNACDSTGTCVCSPPFALEPNPERPQVCNYRCNQGNGHMYINPPPADCLCIPSAGNIGLDPRTTRPDLLGEGCYLEYCVPGHGGWNPTLNGGEGGCVCDPAWTKPDTYLYNDTYYRCDIGVCTPEFPVWQDEPAPGFCIDPNLDPIDSWPCAGRGIVTSAPGVVPITCDCFAPYTDASGCKEHECAFGTTPLYTVPPITADGVCDCSTPITGLTGPLCDMPACVPGHGQWDDINMQCQCFKPWIGGTCADDGCWPPVGEWSPSKGECVCQANENIRWAPTSFANIPDACSVGCPPNSYFDNIAGECVCDPYYYYEPASGGQCNLFCVNGSPVANTCDCDPGWSDPACLSFDCGLYGEHSPTSPTDPKCVCNQFWNGPLCDVYCAPEDLWRYDPGTGLCSCQLPGDPSQCGPYPVPPVPPGTAMPTQTPDDTNDNNDEGNLALILGLSIGGAVFVILLITLLLLYVPSSPVALSKIQGKKADAAAAAGTTTSGRRRRNRRRPQRNRYRHKKIDDESESSSVYGSVSAASESDSKVRYF